MSKPKDLKTERPFLLVLGNDFLHKNRDFAIKVWQELLDQGHSIDLVLAGLHVKRSSSKRQEQELIDKYVNLRGSINILGDVTSEERTWLLTNAKAVLHPSSAEGFGFVPYEAAVLGPQPLSQHLDHLRKTRWQPICPVHGIVRNLPKILRTSWSGNSARKSG